MKKLILTVVSVFAISALGATAHACDGMKGHAKGDKTDQSDTQANPSAKKDGKTKADTKS
ncbi:MAG: hypothetical protein ABIS92_04250 [Polyangia bacterium]